MTYRIVEVKGQLGYLMIESKQLREIPERFQPNLVYLEDGRKIVCFDEDIKFLGEIEYDRPKRTNKKDQ